MSDITYDMERNLAMGEVQLSFDAADRGYISLSKS